MDQRFVAIKLGSTSAIARGTSRVFVSEVFGSDAEPVTAEAFAQRLVLICNSLRPAWIFVNTNGRERAKALRPHFELLSRFAATAGIGLQKVHPSTCRSGIIGPKATSNEVLEAMSSRWGARNLAEAEAQLLHRYAAWHCIQFNDCGHRAVGVPT